MKAQFDHASQEKNNKKRSTENAGISMPSTILVHAQLEMTNPGDSDEQEADEMADSIVSGGKIARAVSTGHSGSGIALPSQFGSQLASSQGHGSQLYGDLKNQMESGFGRDFSSVRLHTDDAAAEMSSIISAKAFTYGNDIYFNQGQFRPDIKDGQRLIAHELTHTVQHGKKIARVADGSVPVNSQQIRVYSKEDENDLKKRLEESAGKLFDWKNDTISNPSGSSPSLETKNKFSIIIKDCNASLDIVSGLTENPNYKMLVGQIVQQLYITLSQVMLAMNMFPRPYMKEDYEIPNEYISEEFYDEKTKSYKYKAPKDRKNKEIASNHLRDHRSTKMKELKNSDLYIFRRPLYLAIKRLAALAHNPAIAVLMFEGTYYPKAFDSVTSTAARNAAGKDSDFSYLDEYGAVCNNAAYASVLAAGAAYESSSGDKAKQSVVGLSYPYRAKWNEYNLVGSGVGKNAFEKVKPGDEIAKQGDVLVFWNFSSLNDKAFSDRQKAHVESAKSWVKDFKAAVNEAKKNDYYDENNLQANEVNTDLFPKAEGDSRATNVRYSALISLIKETKNDIDDLKAVAIKFKKPNKKTNEAIERLKNRNVIKEDELENLVAINNKIDQMKDNYAYLVSLAVNELPNAENFKVETEDWSSKLLSNLKEKNKDLTALKEREKNIKEGEESLVDIQKEREQTEDELAELVVSMDMKADHTEVIVGVDNGMYLLAGAHGSAKVNGFGDGNNKLEWKTSEAIRNTRIMRRIPIILKSKREDDGPEMIPVNIPSVMMKRSYDYTKPMKKGTYTIINSNNIYEEIPILEYKNTASEVAIEWLAPKS